MSLTRRDLLKMSLFGAGALMLPIERTVRAGGPSRMAASRLPRPFTLPFRIPPTLAPIRSDATTDYFSVTMRQAKLEILPGYQTSVWGYDGLFPGPTIDVWRGRPSVVRQINQLPSRHPTLRYRPDTSVHLHGSASLPQYDGYASDVTAPGQYKDYQYPQTQEARTLWYHDHGVHRTATNDYMGLVGMYRIFDSQEQALDIPHDRFDVPLIVSDAIFTSRGDLLYDDRSESGLYGDVILVNGVPWPKMQVERRKYRFRLLNASLSRSYRWQLDTEDPLVVIATDGGLVPTPQAVSQMPHANGERYEVVIDFAKYPIGQRVVLKNLSNKNNRNEDNTDVVMAFDVTSESTSTAGNSIPDVLNPDGAVMALQESQAVGKQRLDLIRKNGRWTVNGKTWQDVVDSRYREVVAKPELNSVEVWELTNDSGGWFHPLHIHLVDFKILDRNGAPPRPHELGPKDTVYVGEEETVRVVARFGPNPGMYMVHCHNLVHEDHDMMVQFQVGEGGDDPIAAAPARALPAPPL